MVSCTYAFCLAFQFKPPPLLFAVPALPCIKKTKFVFAPNGFCDIQEFAIFLIGGVLGGVPVFNEILQCFDCRGIFKIMRSSGCSDFAMCLFVLGCRARFV